MNYARAMGPMQFLPGTWSRYATDGDGDGKADVQNVYDATLAAARYLCSGGLNLRDPSQVMAAILRYNNSVAYARNVMGWAAAYATGVVPVDLPPITGPVPPSATPTWTTTEGLGPGLPLNALGLPADDPLALMPMMARTATSPASSTQFSARPAPGPSRGRAPAPAGGTADRHRLSCRRGCSSRHRSRSGRPRCAVFCITQPRQRRRLRCRRRSARRRAAC